MEESEEPTTDDLVAEVIDLEAQKRLWIRTLAPLLKDRSSESDPSGRVQLALDLVVIEASERIRRICRSDLRDEPA